MSLNSTTNWQVSITFCHSNIRCNPARVKPRPLGLSDARTSQRPPVISVLWSFSTIWIHTHAYTRTLSERDNTLAARSLALKNTLCFRSVFSRSVGELEAIFWREIIEEEEEEEKEEEEDTDIFALATVQEILPRISTHSTVKMLRKRQCTSRIYKNPSIIIKSGGDMSILFY